MLERYRFLPVLWEVAHTEVCFWCFSGNFFALFWVWRIHMIPHLCFGYAVIREPQPKTRQRQCFYAIAWDGVLQPRRDRRQCFCAIVWELVSWALLTHVSSSIWNLHRRIRGISSLVLRSLPHYTLLGKHF
ncbi:uncharacterized protein F4817DRAFT_279668 [Daldinia loculata]|uniref:uncharacterized protein n=1 Tax=Daldinia loculata TaxID=103429 RepID=UPI0020C58AE6|nr:uncharacterized protein F4817DRAFT_279668 [Daldinia loculata]KAI1650127.1 hypothetical protein F4817DRAFT_279668 [Daldinia loculata]